MMKDVIAFVSEYLLPHLDQLFWAAMTTVVTTVVAIKAKARFEKKEGKPKKQKGKGASRKSRKR